MSMVFIIFFISVLACFLLNQVKLNENEKFLNLFKICLSFLYFISVKVYFI